MAVRAFSTGRITLDEGTLDTFRTGGLFNGAFTLVATFKRSGATGDGTQYIASWMSSGSVRGGLSYTSGSVMQIETAGTARTFTGMTLTNDTWYTIVVRKAAGTATPQANLKNQSTGTWSGWTNASGTLTDDSNALDEMQIGNRVNDFPINGKIAGLAAFAVSVSDAVADSYGTGFQYWRNTQPVGMWLLTQGTVSAVNDVVGTANQTAESGTSVSTGDDPANFNLTFGTGAPTLLDYAESNFADTSNTETTDDLDWNANGNIAVALGITEDNGQTLGVPTATGLTFASLSGSPTNTASSCKAYAWSATASGDNNSAVSSAGAGGTASRGISAWAYSGTGGLGTPVVNVGTGLTVSVTVAANSSVVMVLGDWNAAIASAPVLTPAGGIIRKNVNINGAATFLVAEWHGQASGTRSYGVASGWTGTGTVSKIATEVTGTAGTTQVNSDLDVRWSVANTVNSDLDVRWSVANVMNSDLDVRWSVANSMNSDLDVRWSVANVVTSDLDARWQVANIVTSDLDVRWNVDGAATQVTSDLDVRWSVANIINSDLDVRWSVSNSVNSDLDVRWSVANRLNSDLDARWSVANRVNSDLDARWQVANVVNSDLDVRWQVANRVNSDLDVRWNVDGTAPSSVEDWGLRL